MVKLRDHLSENHQRAARMFGCVLHGGDSETWMDADIVWRARLTEKERVAMAYSFLKSLDPDQREMVVDCVFASHGMPLPPFMDHAKEACDWAAFADEEQVRTTALACFNEMSLSDQADFLSHVTARSAA